MELILSLFRTDCISSLFFPKSFSSASAIRLNSFCKVVPKSPAASVLIVTTAFSSFINLQVGSSEYLSKKPIRRLLVGHVSIGISLSIISLRIFFGCMQQP